MEAVAWVAGEQHSDTPTCTNPVVANFARTLNDRISDDALRTRLLTPLIPDLLGHPASNPEIDRILAFKSADYAVRQVAPRALESAKLPDEAAKLRALAPVTDQAAADAARDAARAAARAAANAAADTAAYAADAAADAAAYAAADAAADAAARAAAREAARAAANAADAAADAARAAADAYAARAAARAAADAAAKEQEYEQAAAFLKELCAVAKGGPA
jgi:hypothetical protein